MSFENPTHHDGATLLRQQLERLRHLRAAGALDLTPAAAVLRRWQSERLTRTHADLLAHPRYRPAAEFFLAELYGEKDFARRDHDVERAYPIVVRTMPAKVLYATALAVELNALSHELDAALLAALTRKSGTLESLTEERYADAYRYCDNYGARVHQIGLIDTLGRHLNRAVHNPLIYATLLLARGPTHLAGFGALHDFIESGFRAFRQMDDASEFLDTIVHRERSVLERIYAGHPQPFALSDAPISPN